MTKPSSELIAKWYRKAAACPCKPKCRPKRDCPIAVGSDRSLYQQGSGGNDPNGRQISFVQIHGDTDDGGAYTEHLYTDAMNAYGSLNVADHPTAVIWQRFGQAANALPKNYRGRRALIALADTGFVSRAAKLGGVTRHQLDDVILPKFCREFGIDRSTLLARTPKGMKRAA